MFLEPFVISIHDAASVGRTCDTSSLSHGVCHSLLQVVARDDDQGSNSKLSYVLFGGNEDSAFTLSASGELQVTESLDRETKEHFVLMITATDSGKSVITLFGYEKFLCSISK